MFEETETGGERDRSRIIILASVVAMLIVVALVVVVSTRGSKPGVGEPAAQGSPEFDAYAPSVTVIDLGQTVSNTMLGTRLGFFKGIVRNDGNREIVALRLRAVALGFNNEVLAQRIANPVPKIRESLKPGEEMPVDIQIDPLPDENSIMKMTIQLYGLKLK